MTLAGGARLRELLEKWRERIAFAERHLDFNAAHGSDEQPFINGVKDCADELEAALEDAAALLVPPTEQCKVCGRKHVDDVLQRLRSHCYDCRRADPADEQTPANAECTRCGELDCPHNEPLHYHHDGCPACIEDERCDPKAARIPLAPSSSPAPQERWQPISTAPQGQVVLVCWASHPLWSPRALSKEPDGTWENEDGHSYRQPTHWMPLPDPPLSGSTATPGETQK